MIISVDHGNKSIKTPNALFTSGLIVSEGLQGFKTDYICWNNKYYTLTEQRIAYLRDKTEDERFYVLTLFAIAKELERRKVPETLDPIDITLLVGLPPAHYEQLHSRFEQYFLRRREIVDFEYNGKYYSIRISKVLSYPQAFAAAVTQFGTLKAHSVAYIIDIGGFTIDSGRLYWKSRDYFGNDSRSLKLGVSSSSTEGIVDVAFNGATSGRFGVKSVGATSGGAAIYASIGSLTYPASGMTYAGFFVGPVDVRDTGSGLTSDVCASKGFRYIKSRNSDGTYVYNEGVNWGDGAAQNPDLDKIRLIVRGGIIVGYTGE